MPFFWQPDGSNFYKFFQRLGLRLYGSSSGAVGIAPPAAAGSTDYTLPGSAPASNGQALVSTAGGVMSWAGPFAALSGATFTGVVVDSGSPSASTPNLLANAAPFTGGTGTTTFPYWFIQPTGTTAVTNWNTNGTGFGMNMPSGWSGPFLDFRINGSSSTTFQVTSGGNLVTPINCTIGPVGAYSIQISGGACSFGNIGNNNSVVHTFASGNQSQSNGADHNDLLHTATFNPTVGATPFYGLSLAYTINQTGTASGGYAALKINVTETAVLGASRLLADLQTNGVSRFSVSNAGAVNFGIAQTTLNGTTAGTVVWSQPHQGTSYKKFVAYANGYENNTSGNQTITFTTPFVNPPLVTTNITGLTIMATTTTLTIVAPNNTTVYSGVILVQGF